MPKESRRSISPHKKPLRSEPRWNLHNQIEQVQNQPLPRVRTKKRYHLRLFGYKIRPLTLVLLIFLISILYSILLGLYGLTVNYHKLGESKKSIDEKSRYREELQVQKELWQTDEILEEEARKLGMVKEGETLYLDVKPEEEE